MKKYCLLLGAVALLASCSSEPSDFRPGKKVSVDAVYAGGRQTGLYPSADRADGGHLVEGHGTAHGEGHMQGEIHDADASEAATTGAEVQKSAVGQSAVETGATPEAKGPGTEGGTKPEKPKSSDLTD